jgi:asparagine synthase (glutamine-hydrolysing)
MCGICGIYNIENKEKRFANEIKLMNDAIAHRGPDDEGFIYHDTQKDCLVSLYGDNKQLVASQSYIMNNLDKSSNVVLAHRRFSIIDLSEGGHQPFVDSTENFTIAFNGEIYNYIEIREELKQRGFIFKTESDTEVALNAYICFGEECFNKFNGFWAMAIYDRKNKRLLLSRDRYGKKNIYYTFVEGSFYFASEIKSLLTIKKDIQPNNNAQMIHGWLDNFEYDSNSETFFKDIYRFPKATFAYVEKNGELSFKKYYTLSSNRMTTKDISVDEAILKIREIMDDAVKIRLRSDVPFGVELSGGLDSSIIASIASRYNKDIKTYTTSFNDKSVDESMYAKSVAEYLKVQWNAISGDNHKSLFDELEKFTNILEEPYHDPNFSAVYYKEKEMQKIGIKVSLNGAAADELFAGYHQYFSNIQYEHLKNNNFYEYFKNILFWSESSVQKSILHSMPYNFQIPFRKLFKKNIYNIGNKTLNERMYEDFNVKKMNYWMPSGDRLGMSIPIEGRAPFLDYRIVDFAYNLPVEYLIHNGWHKWILRKAYENDLPKDVVWRKNKMGYPFPYKQFIQDNKDSITFIDNYSKQNLLNHISKLDHNKSKLWSFYSYGIWYMYHFDKESFYRLTNAIKS